MMLVEKGDGKEYLSLDDRKKDYASKGLAGTALGFGIAGTAGWLLNGGLGGNLFGGQNVGNQQVKCELVNNMWELAYAGQTARCADYRRLTDDLFGVYKAGIDADFALYKGQRDGFDVTNARIGDLEKKIAVLEATRPYQDALIQASIKSVAEHADFNLYRRTCRMITGEVVLPDTPTVTGYPAIRNCNWNACETKQ